MSCGSTLHLDDIIRVILTLFVNVELVSNKLLRNYIFRILSVLRKKGRDQKWKWRVKIRFLWCLRTNFSEYIKLTCIWMQVWLRNSDVDEFKLMTDYVCWWHLSDLSSTFRTSVNNISVVVWRIQYRMVTVMLVTSLCWWLYDGDWFQMLVAESLCWRLFFVMLVIFQCIKSVTNISNLSQTHLVSNIRHQHRCNPINDIAYII